MRLYLTLLAVVVAIVAVAIFTAEMTAQSGGAREIFRNETLPHKLVVYEVNGECIVVFSDEGRHAVTSQKVQCR